MNKKFILSVVLFATPLTQAAINKKRIDVVSDYNTKNNIVVAVIDTGTDIKHKELENFIWINEGENGKDAFGRDKATNGVDDDDNGFVDDIHGWNFVDNNNNVSDLHGHGTHIAGVIKKEFQKHSAYSTSTGSARLMILKYYSSQAKDSDNVENTVKAIQYAVKMGANIINYSGGGSTQFLKEFEAIDLASKKNILFVAAAGNNNENTDHDKYYPANYPLQNIISVAATDNDGSLVSFSNYGQNSVDIAAPGKLIYSTLPNNSYGFMSGTSQATAYVTGVAASLMLDKALVEPKNILPELLSMSRFNKTLKEKTKFQMALIQ